MRDHQGASPARQTRAVSPNNFISNTPFILEAELSHSPQTLLLSALINSGFAGNFLDHTTAEGR